MRFCRIPYQYCVILVSYLFLMLRRHDQTKEDGFCVGRGRRGGSNSMVVDWKTRR